MAGTQLITSVLLLLATAIGARSALLVRPEQDCINPSVSKVNDFNFFPNEYRSVISAPAPVAPGATVSPQPSIMHVYRPIGLHDCRVRPADL
jgi:hypothetical protein